MFGDGVFGAEGIFWCCAAMIGIPFIYVSVAGLFSWNPLVLGNVYAIVSTILGYAIFGYFFGDAVGILVALLIGFSSLSVGSLGPRKVARRVGRVSVVRGMRGMGGGVFEEFMREANRDEKPKRKNDENDGIIIERVDD